MSKEILLDLLEFTIERTQLAMADTEEVVEYHDFLRTRSGVLLFDATIMRLQTVGETMKRVDTATAGELLKHYPEISWRSVFGLRNIISHEYLSIQPEAIFNTLKDDLPSLLVCLKSMLKDVNIGSYDMLFQ